MAMMGLIWRASSRRPIASPPRSAAYRASSARRRRSSGILRERLPQLRAEPQVRQPQRAAEQGRSGGAAGGDPAASLACAQRLIGVTVDVLGQVMLLVRKEAASRIDVELHPTPASRRRRFSSEGAGFTPPALSLTACDDGQKDRTARTKFGQFLV
jgi:hypothetical protein